MPNVSGVTLISTEKLDRLIAECDALREIIRAAYQRINEFGDLDAFQPEFAALREALGE